MIEPTDFGLARTKTRSDILRMIKDGHWRTDGAEAEAVAWEESVRLREKMFWARVGGGVIPAFVRSKDTPRSSVDQKECDQEPITPENITSHPAEPRGLSSIVPMRHERSVSANESKQPSTPLSPTDVRRRDSVRRTRGFSDAELAQVAAMKVNELSNGIYPIESEDDAAARQLQQNLQDSLHQHALAVESPHPLKPHSTEHQGLGVTIPGAFE